MVQIEIIQYQGESPHPKSPGEKPTQSGKVLILWQKQVARIETSPPSYDPNTQQLSGYYYEHQINNGAHQWVKVWNPVANLSTEEQAAIAQQNYLDSLNWDTFRNRLIDITDGSPYRQISEWAQTLSKFADCKINLGFAILDQDPLALAYAFGDLKNKAKFPNNFSQAQLSEIEACLVDLNIGWTWASL